MSRIESFIILAVICWVTVALIYQLTNVPIEIALIRDNHPFKPEVLFNFWASVTRSLSGGENFLDTDTYYFHIRRLLDLIQSTDYSYYTILGYPSGGEIETPRFLGYIFSTVLINYFEYGEIASVLTASVLYTASISIISLLLNIYTLNKLDIKSSHRVYWMLMAIPALYGYQYEAYQLSLLGYNFIFSGLIFRTFLGKGQIFFSSILTFVGVYLVCSSGDFHNILYLPIIFLVEIFFLRMMNSLSVTKIVALTFSYSANLLLFAPTFLWYYDVMSTAVQNFNEKAVVSNKGLNLIPTTVFFETPILRKIFNTLSGSEWIFKSPTIKLNVLALLVIIMFWTAVPYRHRILCFSLVFLFVGYLNLFLSLFSDVFASETSIKLYVLLNLPMIYFALYLETTLKKVQRSRLVEVCLVYFWLELILLQSLSISNGQNEFYAYHLGVVLVLSFFYVSMVTDYKKITKYAFTFFLVGSALGVLSVGNFRLRENSSHTDFFQSVLGDIIPENSVVSLMPVKDLENIQPNIFMGTPVFSTDGYLSPTPSNYGSFLQKISNDPEDNLRYNDFPLMPFYATENREIYDYKFDFFATDYIITRSELKEYTKVGAYGDFVIHKRTIASDQLQLEIESKCSNKPCTKKIIKYKLLDSKIIFNLRYDRNLRIQLNDTFFITDECEGFFLCINNSQLQLKHAIIKINYERKN